MIALGAEVRLLAHCCLSTVLLINRGAIEGHAQFVDDLLRHGLYLAKRSCIDHRFGGSLEDFEPIKGVQDRPTYDECSVVLEQRHRVGQRNLVGDRFRRGELHAELDTADVTQEKIALRYGLGIQSGIGDTKG